MLKAGVEHLFDSQQTLPLRFEFGIDDSLKGIEANIERALQSASLPKDGNKVQREQPRGNSNGEIKLEV